VKPRIHSGYLVIADITGFTSFLAETELDHAQVILQQILDRLIGTLTPTLTLAEVEGDAVFVYGLEGKVTRGELIAEVVESAYGEFRGQQRTMVRNATCPCRACRQIGELDMKFVIHFGEFILQEIAGKTGPVGSSVNVVHRLLKNSVTDDTGWNGYALYSADALQRMGLPADGMHASSEVYEHLGPVRTLSMDLQQRYDDLCDRTRVFLEADDAHAEIVREFDAPRPVVWDWLNDTDKRTAWMPRSRWIADVRPSGRTGPHASNHCATFNAIEYVLDWRPFDYYTIRLTSSGIDVLDTVTLQALGDRTVVRWLMKVEAPMPRFMLTALAGMLARRRIRLEAGFDEMARLMAESQRSAAR
jgi:hypothetical protein